MYVVLDEEYADKLILEKRLRSFGRYPGLIKNQRASARGIREINEFHLFLFRFFFYYYVLSDPRQFRRRYLWKKVFPQFSF